MFSPLEGYPRGHSITFPQLEGQPSCFPHWKATIDVLSTLVSEFPLENDVCLWEMGNMIDTKKEDLFLL